MTHADELHLWLASMCDRGIPTNQRVFVHKRSAMKWVARNLETSAEWSGSDRDDTRVVTAIQAATFEDPPGRVDKIKVMNVEELRNSLLD